MSASLAPHFERGSKKTFRFYAACRWALPPWDPFCPCDECQAILALAEALFGWLA